MSTTLAAKSWRLVVTEIGGSAVISEANVDAGNWMTALKLARGAIGESGGVPPGASCNVTPDGRVTIHDAVARKTYSLAPDAESSLRPAPKPTGPHVPADPVPRPGSVPPPAQVMPAGGKKKSPAKTIAYDARELGLAPLAAQAPSSMAPQQAIAHDAALLPAAPPATAAAPAPDVAAPPIAKSNKKKKKAPQQTIAYDAAQLGFAPAAPQPVAPPEPAPPPVAAAAPAPEPPARKAPAKTIAYDAKELGLAPPAPPAEPSPAPDLPDEGRMTHPDGVGDAPPLVLLHSRDAEPSAESPLCYRERVYFVPRVPSDYVLEALLSARFEELRGELDGRPKGKLVNLALFDHEWQGRPERPPLLTLQWKDWRGEPVLSKPGKATEGPSVASTPAPAPKAEWRSAPPPPASVPPTAAPSTPSPASEPPSAPAVAPSPPSAPPPAASEPPFAPAFASSPPSAPASHPPVAPAPSAPPPAARPVSQPPGRSDDRLATAFEALQDLFFLTTPMEGLDFVMKLLDDLVPSEAKSICLYDINTDELRFVALAGPGADERRGEGVPRLSGLLGVAALAPNTTVLVEDASADDRFDPGVDGRIGLSAENLAVVALTHQGRLLGVLQLINRRQQAQFSRADANLLYYVAEKLAEFLYSARLHARG